MSIELEVAQYESELKYSKKNLINIVTASMNAQSNTTLIVKLLDRINKYLHNSSYWESKQDYITAILMTDISPIEIAEHIIISTLKHPNTVINNIANTMYQEKILTAN